MKLTLVTPIDRGTPCSDLSDSGVCFQRKRREVRQRKRRPCRELSSCIRVKLQIVVPTLAKNSLSIEHQQQTLR